MGLHSNNKVWKKDETAALIALYETERCLYDESDKSFHDVETQVDAYKRICKIMLRIRSDCTVDEIKYKIKYLRRQYEGELLHRNISVKAGLCTKDTYQPGMWCFGLLQFLDDFIPDKSNMDEVSTKDEDSEKEIYHNRKNDYKDIGVSSDAVEESDDIEEVQNISRKKRKFESSSSSERDFANSLSSVRRFQSSSEKKLKNSSYSEKKFQNTSVKKFRNILSSDKKYQNSAPSERKLQYAPPPSERKLNSSSSERRTHNTLYSDREMHSSSSSDRELKNFEPSEKEFRRELKNFEPSEKEFRRELKNFEPSEKEFRRELKNFEPSEKEFRRELKNFEPSEKEFIRELKNFEPSEKEFRNNSFERQFPNTSSVKLLDIVEKTSEKSSVDREDIFGRYVASELRALRSNPLLYLQTKQSILESLTSANFELINPE